MCSYSKWKKLEKTKFASKNRGQFIKSFFIRIKEFTTLLLKILYLIIFRGAVEDDNPNIFLEQEASIILMLDICFPIFLRDVAFILVFAF